MNNLQDRGEKGELWRVFGKFGNLTNVWVADNPPGFAYVFFENFKDAEDAVRHLDGGKVCGMKVEVKLSPIDDKRSQRNNFAAPRGRGGRGAYTSNTSSRGGGYRPRGGDSSPPPPERPSRFDEDVPRNSRDGGRSEYREARSNAYTERYADRGEKSYHSRDRDDYGPSSQGRGGGAPYGRGRGSYQSNRGYGRGDYNNGGSGGGYTRFSDRTPPPTHRPASSSRGRTSPAPVFPARGRGGYRAEGSGYSSGGGHQYARGRVEQSDQYPSSREGGRGRYGGGGGEHSRRSFSSSAPAPDYDRKTRAYERSRAYASEYEQGGHERNDMIYREHRTRPSDKGSHYHGSAPRAYQRREKELPEREYRKPEDYSNARVRDRSPQRRTSYSSTSTREQFEGSSQEERYEERPAKERKRSHTPVGNAFESRFEDRTPPPPAPHYEEEQPMYPEKRSRERSPAEPSAFSPAHSDYGDLPDETMEGSGEQQPMEDVDHYPKEDEYGHGETNEAASGGYKDRRVEYEGREVREMKYEGHHETERYVSDAID